MKRLLKTSMEKPEFAVIALLTVLIIVFQFLSDGVFLNANNLRGVLGIVPEVALVAIGVTLLMICGEFDLSVGSVFALMPMTMAVGSSAKTSPSHSIVAIVFSNGFLPVDVSV